MSRAAFLAATDALIENGDALVAEPAWDRFRDWLIASDTLLERVWGRMDRYHLAWLLVGKPQGIVRGRPMTADEEAAYVREVADQKTAALRMSLDAAERQGMPFVGESGGVAPGQGMGRLPSESGLVDRVAEARRRAGDHGGHEGPSAPRPKRMER